MTERDPATGRFTTPALDASQLEALDREFGFAIREAANAPKRHLGAPWARTAPSATPPRLDARTDFGGGSRLQARPTSKSIDEVIRSAARDVAHGQVRIELPVERHR